MIRPETTADYAAIYAVNQKAFGGRAAEPELVAALRKLPTFDPALSLVYEEDGQIVGHILFTPVSIETDPGRVPAIALAPVAVLPSHQNRGIGAALVRHGLAACRQQGHAIVIVLGHPNYYPRFGFSAALAQPLACPFGDCGAAWMALALVPGALQGVQGRVVYPPPFSDV